ncbi:hypothetical protein GCM10009814_29320 [Lapillicoccus jejuensis]
MRDWVPEGNLLDDDTWDARHRVITRLALLQTIALGVFALAVGKGLASAAVAVLVPGLPALGGLLSTQHRRLRMLSVVTSLMFASATLVDLTDGLTEAHFHFFVMLGVVSLYQDWAAFGLCVLITVLHHAVMGLTMPGSVFAGVQQREHPVQWAAVHGGFILAASLTHIVAWRFTERVGQRDPLTQLPNRATFGERVTEALRRHDGPVSVLFIDLDNFKEINDSHGHHVGDLALTRTAAVIEESLRAGDLVARLGGDEFAVLVLGDEWAAEVVAARITRALTAPFVAEGRDVFVTASIGVADTELVGVRETDELLRGADMAMYCAKGTGRNAVVHYSPRLDDEVRARTALAADLRHALERGELEVFYQPVVRGTPAVLCGVEALLRWNHPERGLVPPLEFVPLAEASGDIDAIGRWVLTQAAAQVAVWHRELPGAEDLELAVNLSPVQLRDPGLLTIVGDALHQAGLAPGHLIVEVTESMLLSDLDLARRQLDALRTLGIQVAIDDFGTGYSSLSYLARLPADQVKIDKSFVRDLGEDRSPSVPLVRSIVEMARALGLDVQAEGVEETVQETILAELGCDRAQGYLYSRPVPAAQLAELAAALGAASPTPLVRLDEAS